MALSRVWVGRISKTRGVLKTSRGPRFPKFITGFVTIFDQSSLVKFLDSVKKFQKDLNSKLPHDAIDFIQNSSWKLG